MWLCNVIMQCDERLSYICIENSVDHEWIEHVKYVGHIVAHWVKHVWYQEIPPGLVTFIGLVVPRELDFESFHSTRM